MYRYVRVSRSLTNTYYYRSHIYSDEYQVYCSSSNWSTTGPIDTEKIERVKDIVEKLENEDTISVTTTANIETAKKIIAQSETKNIPIIANVVKVQATTKREASQAKVTETRKKIQAMDVASNQNLTNTLNL